MRATRGSAQIEEHYLRESSSRRADKVRARLEEGVAGVNFTNLARQLLRPESAESPRTTRPKQDGLDDGVQISDGVLHLDHLAALQHSPANRPGLELGVSQLSQAFRMSLTEARAKLLRLLTKYEAEGKAFVNFLGSSSFVAAWASHTQ